MQDPQLFSKSVIMLPLWERMLADDKKAKSSQKAKKKGKNETVTPVWYDIIITVNKNFSPTISDAHIAIEKLIKELTKGDNSVEISPFLTDNHLYARLQAKTIIELVKRDRETAISTKPAIHQIWPDFELSPFLNESVKAINGINYKQEGGGYKCGAGITWAVLDSGIDSVINPYELINLRYSVYAHVTKEPTEEGKRNLLVNLPVDEKEISIFLSSDKLKEKNKAEGLRILTKDLGHRHFFQDVMHSNVHYHRDFTVQGSENGFKPNETPFFDESGHGTHVAGVIAGNSPTLMGGNGIDHLGIPIYAYTQELEMYEAKDDISLEQGAHLIYHREDVQSINGVAPVCKLVSIKIMSGEKNKGSTRSVLSAITHIKKINQVNSEDRIHGVNLSAGYKFKPHWYGCGHSPICEELNELVRTGVVVVVAAGNSGYGDIAKLSSEQKSNGIPMTINDPGNAELVITVGSTHRKKPKEFGISFTSSKGPTGDGRAKPDLVAPGERIISCAAGKLKKNAETKLSKVASVDSPYVDYIQNSGTSMAAPHVSGAIAAFLSEHPIYKNDPQKVKEIFMITATDLERDKYAQGAGLVNLKAAIDYKEDPKNG